MPYSSGETPAKGDKVQRIADGRTGRVADVQLLAGNMQGHDVVNIGKFDDGNVRCQHVTCRRIQARVTVGTRRTRSKANAEASQRERTPDTGKWCD